MFSRLKLKYRLALIGFAFSLPFGVMLVLMVQNIDKSIAFNQNELYGNEHQRISEQILEFLAKHRLRAQSLMRGHPERRGELTDLETKLDAAFESLAQKDLQLKEFLQTTPDGLSKRKRGHLTFDVLKSEWVELKSLTAAAGTTLAQSTEKHKHLLADVRELISHVGDTSNLILDPDLDTYYTMDMTLLTLPQTYDRIQEMMASAEIALGKSELGGDERIAFATDASLLEQSDLEHLKVDADRVVSEDVNFLGVTQEVQQYYPPAMASYELQARELIRLARVLAASQTAAPAWGTVTPERYQQAGEKLLEVTSKLFDVCINANDIMIQRRVDDYKHTLHLSASLTLLAVLLSSGFVWFVGRSITGPVNVLAVAATRLAAGDRSVRSGLDRGDEIGLLSQAFDQMAAAIDQTMQGLKEREEEARRLADEAKRANDVLTREAEERRKAEEELKATAAELVEQTKQLEERDWLKTHLTRMTEMLQSERDINIASEKAIRELAPLAEASLGALYVRDERDGRPVFVLRGSYALKDKDTTAVQFDLGEGLVGQCAHEGKQIRLHSVPRSYLKISSGLGEASPATLALVPVTFEGVVTAVIELASFSDFRPIHDILLERVAQTLAIALDSIMSRMRTETLLRESQLLTERLQAQSEELQAQSEEMQAQQEELRTANDELEAKSRLLSERRRTGDRARQEPD
ncbi:MAG: GAF domain-containing protein [Candidatus Wallbacteria bacterium]|nr:GAF domain-containing protein [Candidatus Wallbacteria bacterium]